MTWNAISNSALGKKKKKTITFLLREICQGFSLRWILCVLTWHHLIFFKITVFIVDNSD